MQGEKIGEALGKVTARRVLPNPAGAPKMETSFEANGRLLGVEEHETGTYWSTVRPDGSLYGEGQGILMGKVESWQPGSARVWARLRRKAASVIGALFTIRLRRRHGPG